MQSPCFPISSSYQCQDIPYQKAEPLLDRLFRGNYRLIKGDPDMKVDGIKLVRSLGKNYFVKVERRHHVTIWPAPNTDVEVKTPGGGSW